MKTIYDFKKEIRQLRFYLSENKKVKIPDGADATSQIKQKVDVYLAKRIVYGQEKNYWEKQKKQWNKLVRLLKGY